MNKKTIILITLLIAIFITLFILLLIPKDKIQTPALPIISQTPNKLSPLQKTAIGKTYITEVEKNQQTKTIRTLPNGNLEYAFNSNIEARPDIVVFHNNQAQFERTVLIGNPTAVPMKISDQILKFGPAEKITKGSKFYGNHMDTYIYASKGVTFIANTSADEVYEIQTFPSMTIENYLTAYGEDVKIPQEVIERSEQ